MKPCSAGLVLWGLGLVLGATPWGQARNALQLNSDYRFIQEEKAVLAAAQAEARAFLERIPLGDEPAYGFSSRREFEKIELGRPFRMAYFDPQQRKLVPRSVFRVPLLIGVESRVLLTVAKPGADFTVVELGATTLARELEAWTGDQVGQPWIVRWYQAKADFLWNGQELVPLASAKLVFGQDLAAMPFFRFLEFAYGENQP